MTTVALWHDRLLEEGYSVVREVLRASEVAALISAVERLQEGDAIRRRGGVFAVRNLLDLSPEILALAESAAVRALVDEVLGEDAIPVRGILFDKVPGANWKVPWHQDLTIAVAERHEVDGFGPWSMKAGVLHVQPPACVLEKMLTVRIHLDACGRENGALRVVAGSHRLGRLPEEMAARLGTEGPVHDCEAGAGDALLMRPLLLHASSASENPLHRRVIHVDYAAAELPDGLRWFAE
jgi:ectoine hydroxylase-related dioxygenase (phytanoyl-CoA dioxygenase family)